MQDIIELERRIAAAFDRIDRGLETADRARQTVVAPPTDGVQTGAMMRALETARASSADWAARYATLEAQMADQTIAMATEIATLTESLQGLSTPDAAAVEGNLQHAAELQVMQEQMGELRRQIAAQEAELTSLRAGRDSDIEELKSIVAALTPLIQEAQTNA